MLKPILRKPRYVSRGKILPACIQPLPGLLKVHASPPAEGKKTWLHPKKQVHCNVDGQPSTDRPCPDRRSRHAAGAPSCCSLVCLLRGAFLLTLPLLHEAAQHVESVIVIAFIFITLSLNAHCFQSACTGKAQLNHRQICTRALSCLLGLFLQPIQSFSCRSQNLRSDLTLALHLLGPENFELKPPRLRTQQCAARTLKRGEFEAMCFNTVL